MLDPINGAVSPPSRAAARRGETPRRRLVRDRLARWVVTAGGLAIIVSILGILVFILAEVWPLTRPAAVERAGAIRLPGGVPLALLADEHRSHVAALGGDGVVRVVRDGRRPGGPGTAAPRAGGPPDRRRGAAGGALFRRLHRRRPRGLGAGRVRDRVRRRPAASSPRGSAGRSSSSSTPAGRPLGPLAAQLDAEGNAAAAAVLAGGGLALVRRTTEENLLSGETTESLERFPLAAPHAITALALDPDRRNLYAGTRGGELLRWGIAPEGPGAGRAVSAGGVPVTALTLLIGGRSLVVGQGSGALSVWLTVPQGEDAVRLVRARDFPAHDAAIVAVAPSMRDKGFLALDEGGGLGLYHSTAHRTLWRGRSPLPGGQTLAFAPKVDGAYVAAAGRLAALEIRNPHPEVTWKSLFGKVWYEGYERPEYVWQSSGGTDDFEPKLSLTPLLVGTLKGTFYSLLLAIPLGVFGAMYASQFMHPTYKRVLKPLIEIMAALPSVVLGFLAGLWLAPRVERALPGLFLMLVVLPLAVLGAGGAVVAAAAPAARPLPRRGRGHPLRLRPGRRRSGSASPSPPPSSGWPSAATSRAGCCAPPASPTTSATPSSSAWRWASRSSRSSSPSPRTPSRTCRPTWWPGRWRSAPTAGRR